MFQKNSFANLCVMGWGFFRICCWKTDSYLNGFQTVVLEKGTLEEQYQLQSVSECVCVCVPSELHTKGLKVHFPGREGCTDPTPGWPRPLPELCVAKAGLCTPTNSIFPCSSQGSGKSCCSQQEGGVCPRGLRQHGVGTNAAQVRCVGLPEPATSFSSSPRVCSGGCRAW